ncbi:hypothetical protein ACM66B_007063 [Microbotryomycetes sp. NB124-2]
MATLQGHTKTLHESHDEKARDDAGGRNVHSDVSSSLGSRDDSDGSREFLNVTYTPEEERKLVRKLDLVLLPGLTFLYLLSFLDRANVGNAKLYGMLTDLGITDGSVYNTSLALYFVGYCLFEVPANIVLKKLNPKIWLPTLTIAFGVVATLQGVVKNEAGFLAARFFLGVAEAGLFPGTVFVLSMYYARHERHWRVAIFFGGAAIAGSFGGILAYGLGKIERFGSLPNWSAIFIIEGLFTVLVGVSAFWWVPGYPRQATFLSPREHEILLARLTRDSDSADKEDFSWSGVWLAFKDPHVIGYAFLFHGFAFGLYSLSLFVPTVINQLGYTAANAQLLSIPLYFAAFVGIALVAEASKRTHARAFWIIVSGVVAVVGYVVLLTTHEPSHRYGGLVIAAVGIYSATSALLAWPSMNTSPQTKRATASAIQIFIGDFGAVIGVLVYRPSFSANFFRKAHIIAVGFTLFGTLVAAWLWWSMSRANKLRAEARRELQHQGEGALASDKHLGDRSTSFVYQL